MPRHLQVRVLAVYGGQPYAPQISSLRRGVDVIVGTPGRIIDLMERKVLDLSDVRTVVLDEADEMLNMGFIEDVEAILAATPDGRQTSLFSATLPARIRKLAQRFMREPQSVTVKHSTLTVEGTEQRYYLVNESDKVQAVTNLLEMEEPTSVLIFARTRAETSTLASELTRRGFPAEALNGDLEQNARERILGRFRENQTRGAGGHRRGGARARHRRHLARDQFPTARRSRSVRTPHRQDGTRGKDGHRHLAVHAARKAPPARDRRLSPGRT